MANINQKKMKKHFIKYDKELIEPALAKSKKMGAIIKPSAIEAQIAFIKELVKNKEEADIFSKDPVQYMLDHNIILSSDVIKMVIDAVIFDAALDPKVVDKLDANSLRDIVDMREGTVGDKYAWVVAAAAVAMVVLKVVTIVKNWAKPEDLVALQNLGKGNIKLPGGAKFVPRTRRR